MHARSRSHTATHWFSRPATAIVAALAAVVFFTVVLGLVFLPLEAQRLQTPDYVSITHYLAPEAGRPGASLYWNIPLTANPGWKHHIAVHPPDELPARVPLPHATFTPLSLAKGADVDHILLGGWQGTICSLDLRQPKAPPAVISRQPDGGVVALAWSERAQCVLSQSAFHLYGWDAVTKTERWRRANIAPYCFATRPDAPSVIVSSVTGELLEIDLYGGHTLRTLVRFERPALAVSISPRAREIAVLQQDGRFDLLDLHTSLPLWPDDRQRSCQTAAGRFAAFSPCGTMVVTAGRDSATALAVWSVATGRRLQELGGHQNVVNGATFSTDGVLHSWSADGTIRSWDLQTGAARQIAALGRMSKAG
jgi:WD40 repeat protein